MGGNEKTAVGAFKNKLEQVPRIKPQYGPAVRSYVSYLRQPALYLLNRLEVRGKDEVVYLPDLTVLLVYSADLCSEHKPNLCLWRGNACHRLYTELVLESIQPGFCRFQLVLELLEPCRVGEISGSNNVDALQFRPVLELLGHKVLARGN